MTAAIVMRTAAAQFPDHDLAHKLREDFAVLF